eukprot:7964115-Prorocentrum_lima.AAC.1
MFPFVTHTQEPEPPVQDCLHWNYPLSFSGKQDVILWILNQGESLPYAPALTLVTVVVLETS